jgi:Holliday junction resolvase RusA-like endonuclease
MNDGQATRRQNDSVIDLFLVSRNIYNNIKTCITLTHEKVKSDNIAILLNTTYGKQQDKVQNAQEYWNIKKCNWPMWLEETEDIFSQLNFDTNNNIEENYRKFEDALQIGMSRCIPKVKRISKTPHQYPPWWNEKVKEVNSQRKFRNKSTPENYKELVSLEEQSEEVKIEAQIEWSENLCEKIGEAKSIKDKWSAFKKVTKRKTENLILPLEDGTNKIRFEETDKSIILENTFFGGQHLKDEQFDSQFYDEIMEEYIKICNETNKQEMEDPKCNEYITMEELEGALQPKKRICTTTRFFLQ